MQESTNFTLYENNEFLSILNITVFATGRLYCNAKNQFGNDRYEFEIILIGEAVEKPRYTNNNTGIYKNNIGYIYNIII